MRYCRLILLMFWVTAAFAQPGFNEISLKIQNDTQDCLFISIYPASDSAVVDIFNLPLSIIEDNRMMNAVSDVQPSNSYRIEKKKFAEIMDLFGKVAIGEILLDLNSSNNPITRNVYHFTINVKSAAEFISCSFIPSQKASNSIESSMCYDICVKIMRLAQLNPDLYFQ